MTKICSFNSGKGGVGKSLLCFNFADYLSDRKNKKCLIVDLDYQANISSCYTNSINKKLWNNSKIIRAFKVYAKSAKAKLPKDFKPAHVNKNLDIFVGSRDLENVNDIIRNNHLFAPFVLYTLFNKIGVNNKYDYILIDCHNNFMTLTINALIAAKNAIFIPVNPGKFEIEGIKTMLSTVTKLKDKLVNPLTQQSFIHSHMYFIGNKILSNTRASRSFMKAIKANPMFVAAFHRRELFATALESNMSVFQYARKNGAHDQHLVNKEIKPEFDKMYRVLNK